ncbi:hypothetical protein ZHAS_00015063 [Anopheles sinensis]|uniref:Uncharacterized protein n=1 Tax=Anopheles sinensis TaxID=74873 RepID=A0A084WA00_ANOSI|nr:hypothetical protein ZHAS_00015063 [Anopheles sinensis]
MAKSSSMRFVLLLLIVWLASEANSRKWTQPHAKRPREEQDANNLLSVRLTEYFRLGGILQGIAERTGISRKRILRRGSSEYQDCPNNIGSNIHAVHLVRVGEIADDLGKEAPDLYDALENFIGSTLNVALGRI